LIGRTGVFALGLLVGAAAHSSYSCVRARAGDAFALRDDSAAPMDVPYAVSTPRLPERPAPGPTDRLPSAAEGDIPKGGAPAIAPAPVRTGLPDLDELRGRRLAVPVAGIDRKTLRDSFAEGRTGHVHEAIDILAPRGTPVVAAVGGSIRKLFTSGAGGITIYEFDGDEALVYYYAHLDRYADGIREGMRVRQGDVIGYVGTTGNAPESTPHLHFAIGRLTAAKKWWESEAIDPYPILTRPASEPLSIASAPD
jgi:murein DD-endopeptidase MepM/ murein hydrolase activator NlpD